jgi:hypothetical protein
MYKAIFYHVCHYNYRLSSSVNSYCVVSSAIYSWWTNINLRIQKVLRNRGRWWPASKAAIMISSKYNIILVNHISIIVFIAITQSINWLKYHHLLRDLKSRVMNINRNWQANIPSASWVVKLCFGHLAWYIQLCIFGYLFIMIHCMIINRKIIVWNGIRTWRALCETYFVNYHVLIVPVFHVIMFESHCQRRYMRDEVSIVNISLCPWNYWIYERSKVFLSYSRLTIGY